MLTVHFVKFDLKLKKIRCSTMFTFFEIRKYGTISVMCKFHTIENVCGFCCYQPCNNNNNLGFLYTFKILIFFGRLWNLMQTNLFIFLLLYFNIIFQITVWIVSSTMQMTYCWCACTFFICIHAWNNIIYPLFNR